MPTYLLVAHQTAQSKELLAAAKQIQQEDPDAKFVLLVPATPVAAMLVWERDETEEVARRNASAARTRLEENGLHVLEAKTGDQDPVAAIGDELRERRHRYATIVLSTLPPGLSRWLNMDVISRTRRRFPRHRVVHVVGAAPSAPPDAPTEP
jgi:hypothetical protein